MATQITTLTAGYILIQAGHGTPNHVAPKGSQFTDIDTAKLYFNKNGISDWEENVDVTNSGATISINTFSSFSSSTIGQGSIIATTSSDNLTFSGINLSILVDNTNKILTLSASTATAVFSGGTVNGLTNFTNGLSATTISATTFYGDGSNLTGISTQDTFVTGGTYSNGTATFRNNTGGTFTVTGFNTTEVFVTGGTYSNGTTTFTNNTGGTFTVTGYYTGYTAPIDVTVTGGTYNGGTATFTNNTGGTFNVTGFKTDDLVVTGGTYSNGTILFTNNTGGTFNVTGLYTGYTAPVDVTVTGGTYSNGTATFTNNTGGTFSVTGFKTDDIYTTGMTFNTSNYDLSITRNDGTTFTQSLAILASDMTVTGGTYNQNSGVATFTNNTGGTFSVSGFLTGQTDTYVTGLTFNNNILTLKQTNSQADITVLVNNLSGLTVNGSISATTFYGDGSNLTGISTQDTFVTGGTYSNGTATFVNNTGGTFNVSGFKTDDLVVTGGTYSSGTATFTNNAGGTFSVTGFSTSTATEFTGGTVTGTTNFINGLNANTISATTYLNLPTDVTVTGGTYSNGTILFNNNIGGTFNVTGLYTGYTAPVDVTVTGGTYDNGTATFTNNTGGTFTVTGFSTATEFTGGTVNGATNFTNGLTSNTISATTYFNLPTDIRITGGTYSNNTFTHTNNTGGTYSVLFNTVTGFTVNGNLNITGLTTTNGVTSTGGITFKQVTINSSYTATTNDYMIDITGGTFNVTLPSAVGIQGRLLVIKNNGGGAVTVQPILGQNIDGKLFIILGETNSLQLASNGSNWVALGYNISTVNSSTGVFSFTGLTKVSSNTFNVGEVKGWIVDDTTNPLSPQLYYIYYSGGVHTDNYVSTANETFIYLTSGGTVSQQSTPLTPTQRRQNIFLGKLGHPDKTTINLVFSQPDFVLSPLAQVRDMFTPINLINGGIYPSPNGSNLNFNTSAGYVYGLGINFINDTLNPNALYVNAATPCTFQYRTQTGGTITNVTNIDPTNYDVGGVITPITGTKASNQRIYLLQNGTIRVMYGQTTYTTFTSAIQGIQTESFTPFPNFVNNAVLIGVLTVLSTATDLTDNSKAQFFYASKFGETVGAAGGVSTTTLQQAYNNSSNPEITTNSTLNGVQFRGGTGSDLSPNIIIENNAGNATGQWLANGGLSATTISATTYYNLPTDISVTGGTYSNGTATFTNNTGGTFTVTGFSTSNATTFTGGTVTGSTNFTGGLSSNTISATTYYNLPNTTLQQAYTASTSPEFTINSTQLGVQFRNDTGDDNTPMVLIQNNAGATKGEWRADGTLYAAGLYSTGDVVITGNTTISGTTNVGGDVVASQYLKSLNSSGDEGGEIFLSKSVTNTTLNNGVTIDVYQNKLRFFEQGGTARGVYIDLTVASAGVGTNLLSGGGGEINTASNLGAGTGLFAQKVAADLQFKSLTSTGGTVTISNNSTTVNLEVVPSSSFTGGTVAGATNFTGGLTSNTISATTYYNLPVTTDITVTGGTYSNGSISFTNNTGGTFTINTSTNYAAGVISGATYSSTGTGQINLPAIKVALYNNANNIEPIIVYDVAAGTTGVGAIPALVDQDTNYIVVEYNNGSPRYYVYDNDSVVDDSSTVLFMIAYRAGNFVHTLEFGNQGAGLANKLNDRFIMTDRFGWESGLSLSLSASTGIVMVSSGIAWNGPNRQSLTAVESSGNTFFKNYHVGGSWTYNTSGDTLNNTYYDNGTDIVSATAGKYLTNWYFRGQEVNSHIYEVYGTGEYDSVALAQLATEPALPELITSHAILVGRIIVQVGASTGVTESAFNTVFKSTQVTAHNDLTALQGGSAGQYYHLNSNQYNNLALTNSSNIFSIGQSFTDGLTANTISATTYFNLPVTADTYVTDFTYDNANTFTITNNTGGTLTTTVNTMTGLTVNGTVTATNLVGDGTGITNITATVPYGLISAISSGNFLI